MAVQTTTRVLSNGYKVVSRTIREMFKGNPRGSVNTLISVYDDAGKLVLKRDKTVLRGVAHYTDDFVPKNYNGANTLYTTTTFPQKDFGDIEIFKAITDYSGLVKKTNGRVTYPSLTKPKGYESPSVIDRFSETIDMTPQEALKYLKAESTGQKYDTSHYPEFLKDMIKNYIA